MCNHRCPTVSRQMHSPSDTTQFKQTPKLVPYHKKSQSLFAVLAS